jgi:hypothetical protein
VILDKENNARARVATRCGRVCCWPTIGVEALGERGTFVLRQKMLAAPRSDARGAR